MDESEKYGLRYHNQWMIPKRVLGTYTFSLSDQISEDHAYKRVRMMACRSLISEDCNIDKDEIQVVQVDQSGFVAK